MAEVVPVEFVQLLLAGANAVDPVSKCRSVFGQSCSESGDGVGLFVLGQLDAAEAFVVVDGPLFGRTYGSTWKRSPETSPVNCMLGKMGMGCMCSRRERGHWPSRHVQVGGPMMATGTSVRYDGAEDTDRSARRAVSSW